MMDGSLSISDMTYHFARIDLDRTNYPITVDHAYVENFDRATLDRLQEIYRSYCQHRKFPSVMPMFESRFFDTMADVIAYYSNSNWVAWSLIRRYDDKNAMCDQFAWTYHEPRQRLGIETLKTECAIYKARGFRYLYLEQAHFYKQEIAGFELLGPIT
jgi:hypothetical protein